MPRHYFHITGLLLLLTVFVSFAAYVKFNHMHQYAVVPFPTHQPFTNVLAIQPNDKHSHKLGQIENGTLFLLMKTDSKLFYLTSFKQIASFGISHGVINPQNPIYPELYIGRFDRKSKSIQYRTLEEAKVKRLVFFHKNVDNLSQETLKEEGYDSKVGINAGAFMVKIDKNGNPKKLRIGSWPYSQKILHKVGLKPDTLDDVKEEVIHDLGLNQEQALPIG